MLEATPLKGWRSCSHHFFSAWDLMVSTLALRSQCGGALSVNCHGGPIDVA